ncbi:MAG: hypothetical protein PHE79_03170 [Eubacteriales bacterium]|nr:hypothetical protein [Eubacteriales bacterium]
MSEAKIEKAKSISLVVLFLSTILLLCFFWGHISLDSFKFQKQADAEDIPDISYMIKPNQIIVNFGADNYTIVSSGNTDVWCTGTEEGCMVKAIEKFGNAENILVEEIPYEKYQEVMTFRSILAEFTYDIPIVDFFLNFKIKKPSSYDVIETITSIGYSEGSKNNLFIYDGKNNKYYRLVADMDNHDFETLIAAIEGKGYNIYYPASTYLGVENNTLIPLEINTNLSKFPFRLDSYPNQSEKINTIAENFFGGNFDFVREITEDSGTVIYMYSYGKKVLIVNTDGSIEYKEEQIGANMDKGFLESLETAVQYVARHGSWKSLNGAKLTPYLKDVSLNPNKEKGFRFTFGMEVNGSRLFYEEGESIVIDVIDGHVTYYKRNMIDFDQEDLDAIETFSDDTAFSAVNLIAKNYEYIYNIIQASEDSYIADDQASMFEAVGSAVDKMQVGYVRMADKEAKEIYPAWIISINNINIFFDLYNAEPIGHTKK